MIDDGLAGIGVLVTRPRHQAAELVAAITASGGVAIEFPVIDIIPCDREVIDRARGALRDPDIVIFVSPNSVRYGLAYAESARIAVVGPATAKAVESAGRSVDIRSPSGYDSEHLLVEPELQDVKGRVVRIVRGASGRELLADTLRDRGAIVDYLPVYERQIPDYQAADIEHLERQWRAGAINVITIMSVESLHNLFAVLPEWCISRLEYTPLVTPAARVIQEARDRFPDIPATLARGPGASEIVDAIMACTKDLTG
ncbi:MAG: uroporphyrinogen-III synthase [Gammaproteobacteria bacterium]|nr:uroporphyrinogen-III synthase [Gammaproteobacteria bacterium]